MNFGNNNNYAKSNIRKHLNECKLRHDIEDKYSDKIISFKNNLLSMDGFDDYGFVEDDVLSIPTFDLFRKCGKELSLINRPYWLSTPNQTPTRKDSSLVRVVDSNGRVSSTDCYWFEHWVRPFFITKS